jgi:hypothetical protein
MYILLTWSTIQGYKTLIRPQIDCTNSVWDPYLRDKLENISKEISKIYYIRYITCTIDQDQWHHFQLTNIPWAEVTITSRQEKEQHINVAIQKTIKDPKGASILTELFNRPMQYSKGGHKKSILNRIICQNRHWNMASSQNTATDWNSLP